MPLPDAMAMASYLLMLGDRTVLRTRDLAEPDGTMKEALEALGRIWANSVCGGSRARFGPGLRVRFAGCQGVRDAIRPALAYPQGEPLVVGKARIRFARWECFRAILTLPGFVSSAGARAASA